MKSRSMNNGNHGATLWFTGLPCSGKTTVSQLVFEHLRRAGTKVELLDGDAVRQRLTKGLGFNKEDRDENIRRIGFVCHLLTRNGVIAIAAAISPYRAVRDELRSLIESFVEIYVDCPLEVCKQRDVKGMYKRALAGGLAHFTGVSDPYEEPLQPELVLHTSEEAPEDSARRVLEWLHSRGYWTSSGIARVPSQAVGQGIAGVGTSELRGGLMIDLHTHTTASDGTLPPEALVDLAAEKGLRAIAITDHDTVAGVSAAIERGNERGVLVIPGVELSARWDGPGQMHILGYSIDHKNCLLLERLSWLKARREDRAREIIKRLGAIGVNVSWERVLEFAGGGAAGRPHVARALIETGEVQSISEAFERLLNPGRPGFLENTQLSSREAIELIHSSDGLAVLAHPATLELSREKLERCVIKLISEGLKGIEVYWSKHDQTVLSLYEELASRYGLIKTGGSDFHGANKPDIELGTGLNGHMDEDVVLRALGVHIMQPLRERWGTAKQPSAEGTSAALKLSGHHNGDAPSLPVTVMGAGYAGLVVAAGLSDLGHKVTCVDIDEGRIALLRQGKTPIFEPQLAGLIRRNSEGGWLSFAVDGRQAIKNSLAIFVAVGTNSASNGEADLGQVWSACDQIAQATDDYKVVVVRSTVPVGTAADVEARIRRQLPSPVEFDVVSNPEFLREGSALEDFFHPNRIIIGASSDRAAGIMKEVYHSFSLSETPIIFTTQRSAELAKYAANAFLALKISFVNELANLCEAIGLDTDIQVVTNALGLDPRIGPTFLHPGPGFGGSCLPKDTLALSRIARRHGQEFRMVEAAITVNSGQYLRVVEKLKRGLGSISGKKIAVLGLAFKANTDDIRESRALKICGALREEQCELRVFDPVAMENARRVLGDNRITYCSDGYEAASGCDAVVIATEWNEIRNLDLIRMKQQMRGALLVDARNVFDPSKAQSCGFRYLGMGRGEDAERLPRHREDWRPVGNGAPRARNRAGPLV